MKHLALIAGTAVLAAALAGPATAAPIKMRPGLWEITVSMKTARFPRLRAQSVMKRCIAPTESAKSRIVPRLETRPGMTCTLASFSRFGNSVTYTRVCSGQDGRTKSQGKITMNSPSSYTATVHTTGHVRGRAINITRMVQARRTGPCSG